MRYTCAAMPESNTPESANTPHSLTERAAAALRDAIVKGELIAGQPLRQVELAQRLGLSRVPLREALRLLEGEGFVVIHPNRGAVVATLSSAELREIAETCRLLERNMLELAVPKMPAEAVSEARRCIAALDKTTSVSEWIALNWEFHRALYTPANRPRTLKIVEQVRRSADPYFHILLGDADIRRRMNDEHREIANACEQRDAARAIALLDRHVGDASEHTRARIAHLEATHWPGSKA
jgi:DNA-binding GntR family transcriptional regulator